MWLSKFKIAIIEKNTEQIDTLLEELPTFTTEDEMKEAQYLMKEAAVLLLHLKNQTQDTMQRVQKNLSFLKSTQTNGSSALDIKS